MSKRISKNIPFRGLKVKGGSFKQDFTARFGHKNFKRPNAFRSTVSSKFYYLRNRQKFKRFRRLKQLMAWNKKSRLFKWHKCKRPFWKRRSYRRILNQKRAVDSIFRAASSPKNFVYPLTPRRKKIFWVSYYKRNSFRRNYKNKILFRYYWRFKYFIWSRNTLRRRILSFRRKKQKILRFLRAYELSLDRYVLWWGIIPFFLRDIRYSRILVQNGFILVNFLPVCDIRYQVKKGDCVMCVTHSWRKIHWGRFLSKCFLSSTRLNSRKVLFLRGYRLGSRKKRLLPFTKQRKQRRMHFSNTLFLYLWTHRGWNSLYTPYMLRLLSVFERSYFYHIWVNLQNFSWLNLVLSSAASTIPLDSNCYLINHIVRLKQF